MTNFSFLGTGWEFPLEVNAAAGTVKMSQSDEDIKQAIHIILNTRKGERIMNPEFGSTLNTFVFGNMSLTSLSDMKGEIKNSITSWEPRVENVTVEVVPAQSRACVEITVSYTVRSTNNQYNLVFPYFLNEGT